MNHRYTFYCNWEIPKEFHAKIVHDLNKLNERNKVRAVIYPRLSSFDVDMSECNSLIKIDNHARAVMKLCAKRLLANSDITYVWE